MRLILRVKFWFIIAISLFAYMNVSGYETSDTLRVKTLSVDTLKPDTVMMNDTILLYTVVNAEMQGTDSLITPIIPDQGVIIPDSLRINSPKIVSSAKKLRDTVKYWKTGGCFTLNISQVSLSNWSAGGQNSVAANALINFTANYSRENAVWDNAIDFGFGRLKRENTPAIKTDDKLEILTKYGRRLSKKLYYSALMNFKTQIFPGYDYPEKDSVKISDFLSPGTVFLSVGIDFKPHDKFSFLLSTVTGKTTIVGSELLSRQESFGVDSGKYFRHEFGGYMKLLLKRNLFKFMNYQIKLDAFSNYMEKPENIDWDCELMIWARISKCIAANFKANLVYDDDNITPPNLGARLQLKQFLGVGFTYRI